MGIDVVVFINCYFTTSTSKTLFKNLNHPSVTIVKISQSIFIKAGIWKYTHKKIISIIWISWIYNFNLVENLFLFSGAFFCRDMWKLLDTHEFPFFHLVVTFHKQTILFLPLISIYNFFLCVSREKRTTVLKIILVEFPPTPPPYPKVMTFNLIFESERFVITLHPRARLKYFSYER